MKSSLTKFIDCCRHEKMAPSRKLKVREYECTTCKLVIFGDEISINRHLSIGSTRTKKERGKKLGLNKWQYLTWLHFRKQINRSSKNTTAIKNVPSITGGFISRKRRISVEKPFDSRLLQPTRGSLERNFYGLQSVPVWF